MGWQVRKWRRRVLLFVGVLLVLVGARWAVWRYREHRLRTITAGAVYQSAQMPMDELLEVVGERGIHTVLDLRTGPEGDLDGERRTLEAAHVRYVNLPTPQIPAEDTVEKFLDLVREKGALPMLIHCKHGEGRSVLFAAIYRVELEGWDPDEARKATNLFAWHSAFALGTAKGEYLHAYHRHLPLHASLAQ